MNLDINSEMRVLWVASSGGHISELVLIADALESSSDSVWVTFDVPQTRSLLRGRNVHWVEYIAPRDLLAILRAGRSISGLLSHSNFDICVSTGSAIALSALPAARIRGVRSLYIESLARVAAPSVSGRLVSRIPGVECYSQHRSWTRARWSYSGSLLDSLNGCERQTDGSRPNLKVFVTLGTIRPFRFDGLVDAVKSLLEPGDSVVWQLGSTSRTDLPGRVYSEISIDQMRREIAECDVVVSHAGVGSVLQIMASGKCPVVAARRAQCNEHVDGHQQDLVDLLIDRRVALNLDLRRPSRLVLLEAARRRVRVE